MRKPKVLIVDDHSVYRQGLRRAIETEGSFQVVGEAADGRQGLIQATELEPNLILMDIEMPECDGMQAMRAIKSTSPEIKIVMLTAHSNDDTLFEALKSGADGFLGKDIRAPDLVASLQATLRDEAALSRRATARVIKEYARLAEHEADLVINQLTARQNEILLKISKGLSNKEIAYDLVLSENTVKTHVRNILKKLHLHSRHEAADYSRQLLQDQRH